MKKMKIAALAGVVLALLAVGCSKKEAAPAADGGDKAAAAKKDMAIWHYFDHEAAALNQLADEFNKSHEGVNLVATFMARDELMNQYTVGAVSGQLPDLGMVDSPDMASYIALGVFEDISAELKAWGQLDQFYPGPLSSCTDAAGKIYGLPNNSNCLTLAVNMTMLKAAGLSKPTTWDEFQNVCAKLTKPAEQIYGFAMSAISNEEGTFQLIPWIYAAGGSVKNLASPEAIHGIDFLANLVKKGYMSKEVVNWGQGDAMNAFIAQKAAMVESGTWQIASDLPKIEGAFEVEYTLLPKDKKYASVIGGENFGVCSGTKYKDIAVEFLTYMETAQNNARWCEIAGKLPVRKDTPKITRPAGTEAYFDVFTDGMNYAVARGPHPEWPTISKALYTAGQAAIIGNISAADAMKQAQAVLDPIYAKTPIAQ